MRNCVGIKAESLLVVPLLVGLIALFLALIGVVLDIHSYIRIIPVDLNDYTTVWADLISFFWNILENSHTLHF